MVLSYLKNTKINEIFQSIKSSSIIDKGGFEKIIKFIKDLMNANGEKIIYDILKSQTSKTFRDILKADLNDIFKDNIRPLINDYIISHKEYIKNILRVFRLKNQPQFCPMLLVHTSTFIIVLLFLANFISRSKRFFIDILYSKFF